MRYTKHDRPNWQRGIEETTQIPLLPLLPQPASQPASRNSKKTRNKKLKNSMETKRIHNDTPLKREKEKRKRKKKPPGPMPVFPILYVNHLTQSTILHTSLSRLLLRFRHLFIGVWTRTPLANLSFAFRARIPHRITPVSAVLSVSMVAGVAIVV